MAVKEEEKDAFVPSLCVFKNGAFLNSIFLTDPGWEENDDEGKILKLGRHPDCDIVVDHPSISRWHLQIQLQKSSQELLLTDLSSVHGTFVCGQRVTPKFPISLRVNDTFRMGASTRVYKFQWLPYPSEEEDDCATPTSTRIVSEPDEMNYRSNDENEEQVSMIERDVNAVESLFRNLMETPMLFESVSDIDKQKPTIFVKNKDQALKEHENLEALESASNNTLNIPIYSESAFECNEGNGSFASENNDQVLEENGNVGASALSIVNSLESVSIANKQERAFNGENKEQFLKEHSHTEVIKNDETLESVQNNKGSFARENNEQALKEHGNPGAIQLRILNSLENVSDANKQECAFNGEDKEQFLKERDYTEVIEPVRSNPIEIPIFTEHVSGPKNQAFAFADENKEQVLKEHGHVEAVESVLSNNRVRSVSEPDIQEQILKEYEYVESVEPAPNNTIKIYMDTVPECNRGEGSFPSESKEDALKELGHAEIIELIPSNPVEVPIFLDSVSERQKQVCADQDEFAGENKEQILKENVEAVTFVSTDSVKSPVFLECDFEIIKQEYLFGNESNKQALEEQGFVEAFEPNPVNPIKTPILLESVPEPNKQECGLVEAVESVLSNRVKVPIFLETISESDKQEHTFFHENKTQILKEYELNKEDSLKELEHAEIIEPVPSNPVEIPIIMNSVSECKKQVSADQDEFASENKEHVLKEKDEPVESVPNNTLNTLIYMETVLECNRGEGSFPCENKEDTLKEPEHADTLKEPEHAEIIESVPSNRLEIPILMDGVSECKKQLADQDKFAGENKEQVLKENVEAVTFVSTDSVKSPVFLECDFEIIKQECLSAIESNEQALEEHGFVEAFEPNPINLIKTPIHLESGPEPNKQECGLASENKKQVIKNQSNFGAHMLVPYNLDGGFSEENMEQTSMKEGDKVIESDPRNPNQIVLDVVSEPIEQDCEFVHKNKNQFLLEEEYVELVESVPWKPVQPSAPPLPECHSHLDGFTVVNDSGVTLDQGNKKCSREKNPGTGASNLWLRRQKDGNLICLQTGRMEMNLNPNKLKENQVKITKQKRMLKENSSSEIIPQGNFMRCDKKNKVLGEKKRDSILQVLPPEISAHGSSSTGFNSDDDFYPSDKENCTPKVSCQTSKKTARKIGREDQDTHLLQTDKGRAPFQSVSQNSRVNNRPTISSSMKNTNRSMDNYKGSQSKVQISGIVQHSNLADSKKKWHMVVDTGCLIHEESRQALKQLEGIKGTQLIIPRIVIRELDCLKRQNKSKKGKDAQEFLKWIEECMTNKGWWVHVQNSAECFSFGVTPPASPLSNLSAGSNDASASVAFSSYGSFADVLSPTAEDHILECALLYKRLENGGRVILLSNDVALKVKAMAEGLLCENAKEFCQSLVSPYSERFLWSQSTAHGHNWTDINNISRKTLGVTRKLTYFGMMRNSFLRDEEPKKKSNEGAKGLKLILLHNSHYGQKHT